jgi:hypothetical protein
MRACSMFGEQRTREKESCALNIQRAEGWRVDAEPENCKDLIGYRVLLRWISRVLSFSVPLLGITSSTPASLTYIFKSLSLG